MATVSTVALEDFQHGVAWPVSWKGLYEEGLLVERHSEGEGWPEEGGL